MAGREPRVVPARQRPPSRPGHEDLTTLDEDDYRYIWSHLMALVAASLQAEHGGEWIVVDEPDSLTYAHYLIAASGKRFNPRAVAYACMHIEPPRDRREQIAVAEWFPERWAGLAGFAREATRLSLEWETSLGADGLRDQKIDGYTDDQRSGSSPPG